MLNYKWENLTSCEFDDAIEKALKKVYLDGGYIYTYPGIFEI